MFVFFLKEQRVKQENAVKIQKFYRGYVVRKHQVCTWIVYNYNYWTIGLL